MLKSVKGRCLLIGTGASSGVPVISCDCAVCKSNDPYNKRWRPAALVTLEDRKILIDAGPDLRSQALHFNIKHIDGVALTHVHYDHTGGIDDLRAYYYRHREPLPCLASLSTINDMTHRCSYLFDPPQKGKSLTAQIEFEQLYGDRGMISFLGYHTRYVTFEQGGMAVNGFRWGDFAYISDIKEYPETIFEDLEGVKTLVLSALRKTASFLHFSLDDAVSFAQRIGAEQTWITHIAHELDHHATNAELPKNVQLGHDGLSFEFNAERFLSPHNMT